MLIPWRVFPNFNERVEKQISQAFPIKTGFQLVPNDQEFASMLNSPAILQIMYVTSDEHR